jgi:polysaccharide biosynthesis protein PslG
MSQLKRTFGVILAMVLLGACTNPIETIRIIITPTPAQSATPISVAQATEEQTAETTQDPGFAIPASTTQPIIITNTPLPTRTPITGDGTFMGSILLPDYTITPAATNTPTEIPTGDPNLPTVTPISVSSPNLDPIEMGVQMYYNMEPEAFGNALWFAQQVRVGWVKFQVDWSALQPNAAGEITETFTAFTLKVQQAKGMGFRTMLSIAKAPQWARGTNQAEDGPPDNPQALIDFLQLLITTTKPEFIDAIEIWNEPNLRREWQGRFAFNGAGYMELFVPVHAALRSFAPNIHIITAGLAPTGNSDNSVNDREYLQQMFDAGLTNYPDVSIGVHPYGWGNPPDALCCDTSSARGWDDQPQFYFLNTLNDYRAIMIQNGFEGVQMWVTEFGWATWQGFPNEAPEPWMVYNTPEQQAEYTLRAFQMGQERMDVGPMILWNLNFANETLIENRNEIAGYSLLAPNLSGQGDPLLVRPLYTALRDRPQ